MLNEQVFSQNALCIVKRAEDFRDPREPALRIGEVVRLNSGSQNMLLVDLDDGGNAVVAWRSKDGCVGEAELPEACFHRASAFEPL